MDRLDAGLIMKFMCINSITILNSINIDVSLIFVCVNRHSTIEDIR